MRKNGKKIRLLGVATLLTSQLGVFSSALTVVANTRPQLRLQSQRL